MARQQRARVPGLLLHLECSFVAVRRAANQIRSYLESSGLPETEIWACELAFVEGCNNAVQHTPEANLCKDIVVEVALEGSSVELRIYDNTAGCEFPERSTLPPPECERGRGIYLMRTLMDDVSYLRQSTTNCLVLKKAVTGI